MLLWGAFALMTAAAVFAVLWPLSRDHQAVDTSGDVAVYRDQLAEIDRDLAGGIIGPAEAEAARIEVSRRLIAAAAAPTRVSDGATGRRRAASLIALIGIPAIVLGLYGWRGSPHLPGQPLADRLAAPTVAQDVMTLLARVESHLQSNPEDGRGWEVVAPVYMRLGRPADAVRARANALRLLGPTADRETDYGEALALAAQGVITADAKAAFQRALGLEPNHPKALYFVGLAQEQDGQRPAAIATWTRILETSPPDAAHLGLIRQEIARLGGQSPAASTAPAAPGPTAADVAAARQMAPADQNAMVRGMVDRLAARLSLDFSDFDGWVRLVRAYVVLGERDKADEALAQARRHFGQDAERLGRLEALTRELGLGG